MVEDGGDEACRATPQVGGNWRSRSRQLVPLAIAFSDLVQDAFVGIFLDSLDLPGFANKPATDVVFIFSCWQDDVLVHGTIPGMQSYQTMVPRPIRIVVLFAFIVLERIAIHALDPLLHENNAIRSCTSKIGDENAQIPI